MREASPSPTTSRSRPSVVCWPTRRRTTQVATRDSTSASRVQQLNEGSVHVGAPDDTWIGRAEPGLPLGEEGRDGAHLAARQLSPDVADVLPTQRPDAECGTSADDVSSGLVLGRDSEDLLDGGCSHELHAAPFHLRRFTRSCDENAARPSAPAGRATDPPPSAS